MITNPQRPQEDQEIDLRDISRKAGTYVGKFKGSVFNFIQFVLRNIVIFAILLVVGVGLGYYLDKKKIYQNEIIVTPNFNSVDYLYSKVALINSKIKSGDTVFLKSIGIQDTKNFRKIEIEPIVDAYKFVNNNEQNFDLLKLMAEDGDIRKILLEEATSKNYITHRITFKTTKLTDNAKTVEPLMNFFNDSDHFKKIQNEFVANVQLKMQLNDSIIAQIDGLLNEFSSGVRNSGAKNDKLVYYNENTQLNDVIETKEKLIVEQGELRIATVTIDQIVKEISSVINIHKKPAVGMILIVPVVMILLFILLFSFRSFYKKQAGISQGIN
jgi:uncharacterized membrane protein affecting hemolysin expression